VRIAGDKAQPDPAATGAATGTGAGPSSAARRRRRWELWLTLGAVSVLLLGLVVYAAVVLTGKGNATGAANIRPSGIPRNIPTGVASMMQLSPVSGAAPGFTLTDQRGRTMSLASLRGKVVVLEFLDPHCTDICPIVSQEFVDAYHELGGHASKIVFAAINVNQYHASVRDMAAFSAQHQLSTIPGWHFFTGSGPALRSAWRAYHIQVEAPNPNADIIHTSVVYFISARGAERYLAAPMDDHTANGTAYLPPAQIAAWASGIARLAQDMAS
jgi:cytochrome oxidase Cu insertion factor (SCO1/SenC/PrrC family)